MGLFPEGHKAASINNFITSLRHGGLFQPIKITIPAGEAKGTPYC